MASRPTNGRRKRASSVKEVIHNIEYVMPNRSRSLKVLLTSRSPLEPTPAITWPAHSSTSPRRTWSLTSARRHLGLCSSDSDSPPSEADTPSPTQTQSNGNGNSNGHRTNGVTRRKRTRTLPPVNFSKGLWKDVTSMNWVRVPCKNL